MKTTYEGRITGHRLNMNDSMTTDIELPFDSNGLRLHNIITVPGKAGEIGESVKIEISTASTNAVSN